MKKSTKIMIAVGTFVTGLVLLIIAILFQEQIMKKYFICCFCKKKTTGYGNNPAPVLYNGLCCDKCNMEIVIPARLKLLLNNKK